MNETDGRAGWLMLRAAELLVVITACLIIAGCISMVMGGQFIKNSMISFGFGVPAYLFVLLNYTLFPGLPKLLSIAIGQVLGVIVGALIAVVVVSDGSLEFVGRELYIFGYFILLGSGFALIGAYTMYNRSRVKLMKADLFRAQQQRLRHDKDLLESELKALQAQIEPHFLFNTLANIQALIDSDADKAKLMLQNFTDLLRSSLSRTRSEKTSLGQEIDIVEKYLAIQQQRLGSRLVYMIDCPDDLKSTAFPPLLIQPLIENAIVHGIEPQVAGGRIELVVARRDKAVVIRVSDDGRGLNMEGQVTGLVNAGSGVGMENSRNRLKAVFGRQAAMRITENKPSGVVVELDLGPIELDPLQLDPLESETVQRGEI